MTLEKRNSATMLVQPTLLRLLEEDGPGALVTAEFRYDQLDPFAVTLVLDEQSGLMSWTFARDLMADGLDEPAGDGDVHVWPGHDEAGDAVWYLELSVGDEEVLLAAFPLDVSEFLDATYRLVEPGHELCHLDIDGAIAAILNGSSQGRIDD